MITYNNTLIEYFKANDTAFKKYVNSEFEKSNISSFIQFVEGVFKSIGIITTTILPIDTRKWMSYYEIGPENIFSKEPGKINISTFPLTRKESESKLAIQIIELLSNVNMSELNNRIN